MRNLRTIMALFVMSYTCQHRTNNDILASPYDRRFMFTTLAHSTESCHTAVGASPCFCSALSKCPRRGHIWDTRGSYSHVIDDVIPAPQYQSTGMADVFFVASLVQQTCLSSASTPPKNGHGWPLQAICGPSPTTLVLYLWYVYLCLYVYIHD